MPLYDFRCPACDHRFEARAGVEDAVACPACGNEPAERVLTGFATSRSPALRGLQARRSDAKRAVREEQRAERKEQRRQQRAQES